MVRWIWVIGLGSLLYYCFKQTQLQTQRRLFWSAVPALVVGFISNITWLISASFFDKWKTYYDNAEGVSLIWMLAILFSQNKLNKQLEKERKERKEEEARNRAIALRKVELEELVRERTAEISQQKEALEKTLNELKSTQQQLIQSEKMASLGELTAGIAHEIQNPLNFVNNFSEVSRELIDELKQERVKEEGIRDKVLEEELLRDIDANLEKINHHGQRAASIVKGMLQHSRTSSGQKEPTDINALCDEYLRLAYHGLRAKDKSFNAAFKTEFDPNLPKVNIVPQDMGRVVLNLINNAFFAVKQRQDVGSSDRQDVRSSERQNGDDDPTIRRSDEEYTPMVILSTRKKEDTIEITVSDNGTGIPNEIKEKIFQPFFTTKPTGQGTGLGLSLAYDIVTKAHGGNLTVESELGKGTIFKIEIPYLETT
jgi:signal transduction histidine kinase